MKLRHPALLRAAGFLGAQFIRHWMSTIDHRAFFYDPVADPAVSHTDQPIVYVIWHEYLLTPLESRGHCDVSLLIGRHADADILRYATRHLGFDAVRGSTNRGGVAALRELTRDGRRQDLVITPDGPRGPRRRMAQGAIYLASRIGMPLVCCGVGYDRPYRARSWDRFAVPRPFSRMRSILSPRLRIPANLDRAGIEHYRRHVERLMNRLTADAEAWATSGERKAGEQVVTRRTRPLRDANDRLAIRVNSPGQTSPTPVAVTPAAGPSVYRASA
jgi:lysophospholipid acyltransferase (LPLAT)-like uncharacterized protein